MPLLCYLFNEGRWLHLFIKDMNLDNNLKIIIKDMNFYNSRMYFLLVFYMYTYTNTFSNLNIQYKILYPIFSLILIS